MARFCISLEEPRGRVHAVPRAWRLRRSGVISPKHGTLGALLIKEAGREVTQGVGLDMLIACGFAFDATMGDGAKRLRQSG